MSFIPIEIIGEGEPLVLLHGWGWHSAIWQPLIPTLSQHYQLFLVDLPGCGRNAVALEDYSFENIANLIFPLVPEKCHWLGWSLGGMLAWWIAIHHPEKVKSLMTVCSSPKFVGDENWPGVAMETLTAFSQSLMSNTHQTLSEFLQLQLRGNPKNKALFPELEKALFSASLPAIDALQGGLELLRTTDLRGTMSRVVAPSLHLFGSTDTLVPVRMVSRLQEHLPEAKCEIIHRAGHIPFLTDMGRFLEIVGI